MHALLICLAIAITHPPSPRPANLSPPNDRHIDVDDETEHILDGERVEMKVFHAKERDIVGVNLDETRTRAIRIEAISRGVAKPMRGKIERSR